MKKKIQAFHKHILQYFFVKLQAKNSLAHRQAPDTSNSDAHYLQQKTSIQILSITKKALEIIALQWEIYGKTFPLLLKRRFLIACWWVNFPGHLVNFLCRSPNLKIHASCPITYYVKAHNK